MVSIVSILQGRQKVTSKRFEFIYYSACDHQLHAIFRGIFQESSSFRNF